MRSDLTHTDRYAATQLVRTRFRGRADLERQAQRTSPDGRIALAELEERLGIASAGWARAEKWRADHESCGGTCVDSLSRASGGPHLRCARCTRTAKIRKANRPAQPPAPGRILAEQARRRLRRILADADLRTATHGHRDVIGIGPAGASSSTSSVHPSTVGLGAAYCRRAYSVTISEHRWTIPMDCRPYELDGRVYLSETVRVRQGRGTSLVTEVLVAGVRRPRWEVR